MDPPRKILLSHHWLLRYRGGEQVLEQLCRAFPDAPIATLFHRPDDLPALFHDKTVYPSILSRLPFAPRFYRHLLPLHPLALRFFPLPKGFDVVICSDAALMKGMRIPEDVQLICYCHSPPRYLWDLSDQYSETMGGVTKAVFAALNKWLRRTDLKSAKRVDHFIANSSFVAERIRKIYGRESAVIFPPVKLDEFSGPTRSGDYYLVVSELVPYKKADLVVRAFRNLPYKLKVIGGGPGLKALKEEAGPNTEILGYCPREVVIEHFLNCRAYIQPQLEDFGITAVEAQAAGKPVIGFGEGGLLDIVTDGETGRLFGEQTEAAVRGAVEDFEEALRSGRDDGESLARRCRENARRFSVESFRTRLEAFVEEKTGTPVAPRPEALEA